MTTPVEITYKFTKYTVLFCKDTGALDAILLNGKDVLCDFDQETIDWIDQAYNPFGK